MNVLLRSCSNCGDYLERERDSVCRACTLAVNDAVEAALQRRRAYAAMFREA